MDVGNKIMRYYFKWLSKKLLDVGLICKHASGAYQASLVKALMPLRRALRDDLVLNARLSRFVHKSDDIQ